VTESELAEARRTIERLESELAHTKEVQEDLWAHEIYIKARKKMSVGVFAILGLLSALGLYTAFEIYRELVAFSVTLAKETIQENIDAKVDKMVGDAEPRLREQLDVQVGALIENQKKTVQEKMDTLNAQVNQAKLVAQRAAAVAQVLDAAANRSKDITLAAEAPDEVAQEVGERAEAAADCDTLRLTESQRALVHIRQDSEKTDTVAGNGLPYYRNTFNVAAHSEDRSAITPSLTTCLLDDVDRVVYKLNERWFSPSEIVKVNKADRFSLSLRAWGPTEIDAAVYLKGERDPIQHHGSFITRELGEQYLAPGPRDPHMRGDRPE
jgi:hypothetical protein